MKVSPVLLLILILSSSLSLLTCRRNRDPKPDKNLVVIVGAFDKGGKLYAFNASTGETKWTVDTQKEIISSPAVANGFVYFGSESLFAVDINTGKLKWQYDTGDFVYSSPAVANGVVYVGCNNGYLYAIDATTGLKKWAYRYPEQTESSTALFSSPYVANGIVYINTLGGRLLAVDAITGTLKWNFMAEDYLKFNPIILNGTVYINCLHILYALDSQTGKLVWRTKTAFDNSSTMSFYKTTLVCNNGGMNIYTFDAKTGQQRWKSSINEIFVGGATSSPTIADDQIYVSMGEGNIYAIDLARESVKWKTSTGAKISSSPTVANGVVYVGNWDKRMYAVDAKTGNVIWSKRLNESIDISSACVLTTTGKTYYSANKGASL